MVSGEELKRKIAELEHERGKFLISCEIRDGKIVDATYTGYGEGDWVLDVWDCRGTICKAHRDENGSLNFTKIYSDDSDRFHAWCLSVCEAGRAMINRSGIYPIKRKIPEWLLNRIVAAAARL